MITLNFLKNYLTLSDLVMSQKKPRWMRGFLCHYEAFLTLSMFPAETSAWRSFFLGVLAYPLNVSFGNICREQLFLRKSCLHHSAHSTHATHIRHRRCCW